MPLCLVVAFLLPATQINPATNRKITAQNYCPPCQLGKLPSSRISMDILALRAQNLQQLGASLIKSHSPEHSVPCSQQANSPQNITGSQPIQQCTENRCSQQRQNLCSRQKTIVLSPHSSQHPSPSNGVHIPLFPSLIPPCRLTQLFLQPPSIICPSS